VGGLKLRDGHNRWGLNGLGVSLNSSAQRAHVYIYICVCVCVCVCMYVFEEMRVLGEDRDSAVGMREVDTDVEESEA
jgi:hypothetical protein